MVKLSVVCDHGIKTLSAVAAHFATLYIYLALFYTTSVILVNDSMLKLKFKIKLPTHFLHF